MNISATRPRFSLVLRNSWLRAWRGNLMALAAELAFYEFLAVFPLLIFLLALVGLLPVQNLLDEGFQLLSPFTPARVLDVLVAWMEGIRASGGVAALVIGGAGLFVTGSAVTGTYIRAFRILGRERIRGPFFTVFALRFFFSILAAAVIVMALLIWVAAPALLGIVSRFFALEEYWLWIWYVVRMPLGALLVVTGLTIIYHVLGFSGRRAVTRVPGALVASAGCYLASWLFSLYLRAVPDFNLTYGSLGGIVILMIWLQVMNLAILFGEAWNEEWSARR